MQREKIRNEKEKTGKESKKVTKINEKRKVEKK